MYAEASAGIREAVSATEGVEAQALEAAALRDGLKRLFRGNPSSTYKIMDPAQRLAEYYEGDAAAMMDAAGRTSPYVNALGAAALGGGIVNGARSDCGCQ